MRNPISTTLVLILIVIGAYLAAHLVFEWLARRFMIVSGAEYLLLGVLLGPGVSGLITADVVGGFAPLMTLALGWIGAVIGAQFYIRGLARIPGFYFRIGLLEALLTLGLVTGAMWVTILWLTPLGRIAAVAPAVALGCIAAVSAPSGIALISRRVGRRDPVLRQLEVATAMDAAVAIIGFGLLLSLVHSGPTRLARAPTATEWAVISVAIGFVGGALFHLFLGGERKIDRLFISLAGAIILASGAAAYLRLSPLLPTMLIGATLVNTTPNRKELEQVLAKVERPLYFVLLIFAGAAWQPGSGDWLLVVALFLLARTLSKLLAGWASATAMRAREVLGGGWSRALLGQGGLAVAIGLNYRLHEEALLTNLVFSAAIISVLLTDLTAARLASSVIRPIFRRAEERD